MKFIDYRNLNETEIKKINETEKILFKTITFNNIFKGFNEIENIKYYDFLLNENEIKDKILFNIKDYILFENIKNLNDLFNNILINKYKNEIHLFKKDMIISFKINDQKIFNKCINFLDIKNKKLNEFFNITIKYNDHIKKENEIIELIKNYEIELKNIRSENFKIQKELKNKFNYDLYYF